MFARPFIALIVAVTLVGSASAQPQGIQAQSGFDSGDLHRLQSVGDVQISLDGRRIAYSVQKSDPPGRPYSEVWVMNVATGAATRLGGDEGRASSPRWSPDGREIAYFGVAEGKAGLVVSRADGSNATFLAPVSGTNHPLPASGSGSPGRPTVTRSPICPRPPAPRRRPTAIRWSSRDISTSRPRRKG